MVSHRQKGTIAPLGAPESTLRPRSRGSRPWLLTRRPFGAHWVNVRACARSDFHQGLAPGAPLAIDAPPLWGSNDAYSHWRAGQPHAPTPAARLPAAYLCRSHTYASRLAPPATKCCDRPNPAAKRRTSIARGRQPLATSRGIPRKPQRCGSWKRVHSLQPVQRHPETLDRSVFFSN
jgi:hypothetical protein